MQWTINVTHAVDGAGREYRFGQPAVRVGRDPRLEISLDNTDVSRLHFTLSETNAGVQVDDSSRNGTFVRVDGHWMRVKGRTEIALPAVLRAAAWTFGVSASRLAETASAAEPDVGSTWEQSVMLPAGHMKTVREAILVFDLCESSSIASRDDRMAYHMKCRLTQIAEPVLARHGRHFFKNTGDGFLATFADAAAALDAAVELERRIQSRNKRTRNTPMHYRIALHHGDVWAIDAGGDDIHGNDVNITFRIEGVQADAFKRTRPQLPTRDRILCSRAFLAAAPSPRLAVALLGHVGCGAAELKGIARAVDIHWLKTPYSSV